MGLNAASLPVESRFAGDALLKGHGYLAGHHVNDLGDQDLRATYYWHSEAGMRMNRLILGGRTGRTAPQPTTLPGNRAEPAYETSPPS